MFNKVEQLLDTKIYLLFWWSVGKVEFINQ